MKDVEVDNDEVVVVGKVFVEDEVLLVVDVADVLPSR